jgi:hypothetical protein
MVLVVLTEALVNTLHGAGGADSFVTTDSHSIISVLKVKDLRLFPHQL